MNARFVLITALVFFCPKLFSQVGINNTNPSATLDIEASNTATPSNEDGILIPRIDEFPASNPGAAQDGMLVFVTGNGSASEGFYYWDNGTTSWVLVNASGSDDDWREIGTANPPDDISDDIYTLGRVKIGGATALTDRLHVNNPVDETFSGLRLVSTGDDPLSIAYGIYNQASIGDVLRFSNIYNSISGSSDATIRLIENQFNNTGIGDKTGLYNEFNFGAPQGSKFGVYNRIEGGASNVTGVYSQAPPAWAVDGILIGMDNDFDAPGNGIRYGVRTTIGSAATGTGNKYGSYNFIESGAGGTHYGVYSRVENTSGYAGYFRGRLYLGVAGTNRYFMPDNDGTAGQVMTTNGAGTVTFQDPATGDDADWFEEGTTSPPDDINDNLFTQGNVAIGTTVTTGNKLTVVDNDTSDTNGLSVERTINTSSGGSFRGINSSIIASGTGAPTHNSFYGELQGTINLFSTVYNAEISSTTANSGLSLYNGSFSSVSGFGPLYGVNIAYPSGANTNTGDKYGFRVTIPISFSGTHYGLYSDVQNSTGYAGYLIGRTSLGSSTINRYLMPATDGTAGQVMTTDGTGNVTFQDPAGSDTDWYVQGGTTASTSITDDIYTQGNVAIGNTTSTGTTLYVETNPSVNTTSISSVLSTASAGTVRGIENSATVNGTATAFLNSNYIGGSSSSNGTRAIYNTFVGGGGGTKTGMHNYFTSGFSGNARGVENDFSNTGISTALGLYNTFTTTANTAIATGVYNIATSTLTANTLYGNRTLFTGATVSNEAYGTHNSVSTTGTDYGLYARVDDNATDYAAFLSGRVSLGHNPVLNRYFMPGTDGTSGQVMTTDGAGNVTFQDPAGQDADWYEESTTSPPSSNAVDIFTDGNVGIGKSNVQFPLDIETNSAITSINISNTSNNSISGIYNDIDEASPNAGTTTTVGIINSITRTNQSYISGLSNGFSNSNSTSGFGYLYGVDNSFGSSTSLLSVGLLNRFQGNTTDGEGLRNLVAGSFTNFYGVRNYNITGSHNGTFYGLHNFFSASGGNGDRYGAFTEFADTGTGNKYGYYANIANSAGGTHYGIYSDVTKSGSFAGYFLGDVTIGTTSANTYTFPASRGTNGQVMQTDGAGNVSWANATGESSTASNGLTEVGDDIQLGGTLTQDTTIDNSNFDIEIVSSGTANDALIITKTDNITTTSKGIEISKTTNGTGTGVGVGLTMDGTGNSTLFGFDAYLPNTGSGTKFAYSNLFTGTGTGNKYGLRNQFLGSGSSTRYAVYNSFGSDAAGAKYGTYSIFSSSSGNFYGSYNIMNGATNSAVFGVTNTLSGTGTGAKTGISNAFSGANGNVNIYVGLDNSFTDTGDGDRWGVRNTMDGNGNGIQYGVYNDFTGTGTGDKYGVFNAITSTSGGTHYGTYNNVNVSSGWAGYFVGRNYISDRLSIGETDNANAFLNIRGDGNGSVSQIELEQITANTGSRIRFKNAAETDNEWVFFARTDDTSADSRFNLFHTGPGNIISALGNGDVGIKGTPDLDFHIYHGNNGNADGMKLQNTNDNTWWRFYVSSGSDDLRLFNSNNGTTMMGAFNDVTGEYTWTSDRRLKETFEDLYFSWDQFMQLEPLTYHYKKDKSPTKYIGMVAQDVEKIYPELITYREKEDIYHMNYGGTGVIAIKAVQELKKEVESLKTENEQLKEQLKQYKSLEARISALEGNNPPQPSETANATEEK